MVFANVLTVSLLRNHHVATTEMVSAFLWWGIDSSQVQNKAKVAVVV